MLKITIPKPCHQNWAAMTPNEQGRHCTVCAKTVTDFTSMSDEEVKHFFLIKKEEKVCGRFKNEQLHRITIELPHTIFQLQMPVWKKFLAACLIAFSSTLFACDAKVKGEPKTEVQGKMVINQTEKIDTALCNLTVGNLIVWDSAINLKVETVETIGETQGLTMPLPPEIITGEIAVLPIPDTALKETLGTPAITFVDDTVFVKSDSLKVKSLPKADSGCAKEIFY